jgi:hypothetical protein
VKTVAKTSSKSFTGPVLAALRDDAFLYIRAGGQHRFLGIWAVVVGRRAFVRSWNNKPGGWHAAFLKNPAGAIRIGTREIPIRVRAVSGQRLNDAIDRAYLEKFPSKGWRKYALGLSEPARRATTLELLPK